MTATAWVIGWALFLIVGLLGAALAERFGRARSLLLSFLGLGALGLAAMSFLLSGSAPARLSLPSPWPTLWLTPLPLAPLWSLVAAILFGAALFTLRGEEQARPILYALLPLVAGVGVYLWSGDGLLLLMSWEFLSMASYLGLVATRRARPVWQAGWALLTLAEVGGMLLLIALLWLTPAAGQGVQDSFHLLALHARAFSPSTVTLLMLAALIAFGVKAGLFPVMIWMPLAEPEAPGVVAGIFSGLLPALAVSGILALDQALQPGLAWGVLMLVLGTLGALSGALYGIVARHVKRILAYSTLEVLGLVFAALGIWKTATLMSPSTVGGTLALDGAITLLVMHAGAKFSLFVSTDYMTPYSQTLDRLGGLARRAPRLTFWALAAVLTLAAVPPLGGFVGEWLSLEAILSPARHGVASLHLALAAVGATLALAVALGVTAILRWFGFAFLGPLRATSPVPPTEARAGLRAAMALPALLPLLSGPGAPWFLPWLNTELRAFLATARPVVAPTFAHPATAAPLLPLGVNLLPAPGAAGTVFFPQGFSVGDPYVLLIIGVLFSAVVAAARALVRRGRGPRLVAPWTGGMFAYTPRTAFSAEGFVHPLRLAFAAFYGLERERYDLPHARFYRHTIVYRLEEHIYLPLLAVARRLAERVRRTQSGRLTHYLSYVFFALVAAFVVGLLAWSRIPR